MVSDISQGSVATSLRDAGIFNGFITHLQPGLSEFGEVTVSSFCAPTVSRIHYAQAQH